MHRLPIALLLALFALAVTAQARSAQAQTASPVPGSFTAQQRQEIVEVVRGALKADPSILRDAVTALQSDEGQKQAQATQAALAGMEGALQRTPGDPIAGNAEGDVTLVEFYDIRCPYCRRMVPVMAELLKADRRVRVVFKDIPILGPASMVGARAVLAAQRQGGYLKMHDALMTGTPNIDAEVVRAAAQKTGLDWERLQRDMADPAIQARIDANLALARALHIDGTPAYVIGGRMLPGAVELAELQGMVAAARKR